MDVSMDYQIRRAENRDIDELLRLLVQVNIIHRLGRPDLFKGPTVKYTYEELEEFISDDTRPIFVCVNEEGRLLGHAFCMLQEHKGEHLWQDVRTLYIDDICVDENHRGKHIGEALYRHVLEHAKSLSCYNVTLNVWAFNTGALKFYEKCGMEPQKVGMEVILQTDD